MVRYWIVMMVGSAAAFLAGSIVTYDLCKTAHQAERSQEVADLRARVDHVVQMINDERNSRAQAMSVLTYNINEVLSKRLPAPKKED